MNQPNFDEMDALMGEGSGVRPKGSDGHVVDVEPLSAGPRQRQVKKSSGRNLILGTALGAVIGLGITATYFAVIGSRSPVVASPDVIAATLGGIPTNQPPAAAPVTQPEAPPLSDAASVVAAVPEAAAAPSPAVPVAPSPDPALQAKIEALQVELDAAKDAKDVAEKSLQEAKNRPVVTRDANTSFVLVETLIDGAVLRDRAGNEVIVPKGSTVQVAGNRLTAGAAR